MLYNENSNNNMQATATTDFGWDTPVAIDETYDQPFTSDYIYLTPGYYDATIDFIEKGMHGNTGKIGVCPQATIHAHIDSEQGRVEIKDTLYMHPSCKAGLQFFFLSCGIDMKGKNYGQCFAESEGKVARVEIQNRQYTAQDGTQKTFHNDIKRWVKHKGANNASNNTPKGATNQQPTFTQLAGTIPQTESPDLGDLPF